MKVRLDDAPETPKCYRNCEICVVRSGKGKRPEDYVPPPPEELAKRRYVAPREEGVWERPAPQRTALSEALERVFQAAEESAQPTREKKMAPTERGSRSRGGSRRRKGSGEGRPAQEAAPEKKKEQPPRGDKPQGEGRSNRPGKGRGEKPQQPVQQPQNQPSREAGEGGEKRASGSRNRNRRRRRPAGGGQQPKPPAAE